MENKNFTLKEKLTNRDYYLKRAIIYSLITAIGGPYARFIGGNVSFLVKRDGSIQTINQFGDAILAWWIGNAISLLVWLIFVGLTIYYTTKSWKAYKICQEEKQPTT